MQKERTDDLLLKIEDLENRLSEAHQLIDAIRDGEVDAFAVKRNDISEIYTLQSGDYAYRILIEKFGEGALNLTEEGLIVYSNTCFFKLLDLPYEKVVGSFIFDWIAEGSREDFFKLFKLALTGNSKGEISFLVNGRYIPVYVSLTSLQPNLATVGMIITDLTLKKHHEEMIAGYQEQLLQANITRNSAERINIIMEALPQMTWTNQPDGKINFYNQGWYNYTGLDFEQIKEWGWSSILHPDDIDSTMAAFKGALTSGEVLTIANRYRRADGLYRWHLNRALPVRDGNNEITLWVGTATDIDDQKNFTKELEQKVQERTRQLAAKNRELENQNSELASFTYIASHDLQEPLRKIQAFSGRILEKEQEHFSATGRDYFTRIKGAAARMQNLIEALLSYSRTNASDIVFKESDLNTILEEVKRNLQDDIKEKKVLIESTELPVLDVVRMQFHQLFLNLISNAIKYSKPGIQPHIRISAQLLPAEEIPVENAPLSRQYWKISVVDNGIGFKQEYAHRIFELFQRLHGKMEYEGTGIGLAICKKIVHNHHGFIHATGLPGIGADFTIYLPLND
jgi:PAS domain S-box-containing protein